MSESLKIVTELLKPSFVCFGGTSFIKLRVFLESMVERESEGDKQAGKVIEVVERFNRLIEIASKEL